MAPVNVSKIEVADIFRTHIRDYLKVYKMPMDQLEVVSGIIGCRTEWLGGRIQKCSDCGKEIPLDNHDRVIDYVGRYTHRVAISNRRILDLSDGKVTFSYKNREKGTVEAMTIDAVEFIRRFLLHTLPKGLMRIRYYGFLANRCKRESLKKCRKNLGVREAPIFAEPKTVREIMMERTGRDITKCPFCKKGDLVAAQCVPPRSGTSPFEIIHGGTGRNLIQLE